MERPAVVGCVLAIVALTLNGCNESSMPAPPASCYTLEFANGKVPHANLGEAGVPECDIGYALRTTLPEIPDMTCNLVNRECLVTDKENCRNVHAFGPRGTGLTSFPPTATAMPVDEFTSSWSAYLEAQAEHGALNFAAKGQYYLDAAKDELGKVDELKASVEADYLEAKDTAEKAIAEAKANAEDFSQDVFESLYNAAFQKAKDARNLADEAEQIAKDARVNAEEVRKNLANQLSGVTQSMVEQAKVYADEAHEHAAQARTRADEAWTLVQDAYEAAPDSIRQKIHEATAPQAPETERRLMDAPAVPAKTISEADLATACMPSPATASRLYLKLPRALRPRGGLGPQLPVAVGALGVLGFVLIKGVRSIRRSARSVEAADGSAAELGIGAVE